MHAFIIATLLSTCALVRALPTGASSPQAGQLDGLGISPVSLSSGVISIADGPLGDPIVDPFDLHPSGDAHENRRRNLIGDQLNVIGLASQNSAVNNGNTGESASHGTNTGNTAQQVVTDAQSIDVAKNVDVLKNPLILVRQDEEDDGENGEDD
ncbi:hypothetical protein CPC08DRAFT_767096 [Agrocybe pediades]|nr:hypothetical protein CPC08DRAFT_767096 [Agrocybe pediades]